jgi:hypothetical protein
VAAESIAYASNNDAGCIDSGAGTAAEPFCSIAAALTSGRPYLRLLPSSDTYPAFTVSTGNVVITGPGRDASPTATLSAVTVTGSSTTLTLSGVKIVGDGVQFGAVTCRGDGTLYLHDLMVKNPAGRGVDAELECSKVYVDRVRVNNTSAYAIVIGVVGTTTTRYRIINTAVVASGSLASGEEHAVFLGPRSSPMGTFAFNTITGSLRGVGCTSTRIVSNSIVAGNVLSQVDSPCLGAATVITENVDLEPGLDPKLQNTSANDACCVDRATAPTPTDPVVPTDYFGTSRPLGKGYDIGYHELK